METPHRRNRRLAAAGLVLAARASIAAAFVVSSDRTASEAAAEPRPSTPAQAQAPHPVDNLELYLAGVHVMKEDIHEWWDAHHYCDRARPGRRRHEDRSPIRAVRGQCSCRTRRIPPRPSPARARPSHGAYRADARCRW